MCSIKVTNFHVQQTQSSLANHWSRVSVHLINLRPVFTLVFSSVLAPEMNRISGSLPDAPFFLAAKVIVDPSLQFGASLVVKLQQTGRRWRIIICGFIAMSEPLQVFFFF